MSKHEDLIEVLRCIGSAICNEAADALEAQAHEIEGLKAQLAATAKSAFEAMPHDIPVRMKRKICDETGWSMSMVSRAYMELRAAFTGEAYKANEDLDAALLEIEGLRKDAERLYFLLDSTSEMVLMRKAGGWRVYKDIGPTKLAHVVWQAATSTWHENPRDAIDAAKGAPHG